MAGIKIGMCQRQVEEAIDRLSGFGEIKWGDNETTGMRFAYGRHNRHYFKVELLEHEGRLVVEAVVYAPGATTIATPPVESYGHPIVLVKRARRAGERYSRELVWKTDTVLGPGVIISSPDINPPMIQLGANAGFLAKYRPGKRYRQIDAAGGGASRNYFPPETGKTLHYQMSAGGQAFQMTVRNLPSRSMRNVQVVPQETSMRGQTGYAFLYDDGEKVMEFATQRMGKGEIKYSAMKAYEVKNEIKLGETWQDDETIIFMPSLVTKDLTFPVTVTVVSDTETITVPAGTFENCLLIERRGSTQIKTSAFMKPSTVSISTKDWYAPNIGLLKSLRVEASNHPMIDGGQGQALMQLVRIQ